MLFLRPLAGLAVLASLSNGAAVSTSASLANKLRDWLDLPVSRILQTLQGSSSGLEKRVPLSTHDNTTSPLVDLQVYQPPVVPTSGSSCTVQLLKYDFANSYGTPAIVAYAPPTDAKCGKVGQWAAVSMNLTVTSNGTHDPFSSNSTYFYPMWKVSVASAGDIRQAPQAANVAVWRHSSAEPTRTGTVWSIVKDVTTYTPLLAQAGQLLMSFDNIIALDLGMNGVFHVTLEATYYAPTRSFATPRTPDLVIPLSSGSMTSNNVFTISDSYGGQGVTNIRIPINAAEAYVEVYASGNSAEEFWYSNTPDQYLSYFPESSGLIGKGPFREVQVLVDGVLAGVVWPFAVIYTGGVTPTNWRPLVSYGAYNQPSYYVDITPFLPTLTDSKSHNITLTVFGQGLAPVNSINSNWFVSGNVQLSLGASKVRTTGRITKYSVAPFASTQTSGGASASNTTVHTRVTAKRTLRIESEIVVGGGKSRLIAFDQDLEYENVSTYESEGFVQWVEQSTKGITSSMHTGTTVLLDAFSYPLSLFSNYTLYNMQYGAYNSAINQTFTRSITPPPISGSQYTIHSDQIARGAVGMDDAPGLRHAINGTGETSQSFGFVDGSRGETYFRRIHAKNDGWVSDAVWGSLGDRNGPVRVDGPDGGPGFRR